MSASKPRVGVLGEAVVPTVDANGKYIMMGMDVIHGSHKTVSDQASVLSMLSRSGGIVMILVGGRGVVGGRSVVQSREKLAQCEEDW